MFNQTKLLRYIFALALGVSLLSLTFSTGCGHGVGRAINDAKELENEVEKRNQELEKLSNPD